MKKWLIIALVIIGLISALLVFDYFRIRNSSPDFIQEIVKSAVEQRDPSECSEVTHDATGADADCFKQVAVALQDETICDQTPPTTFQGQQVYGLYSICYNAVNEVKHDPNICQKINTTHIDQATQSQSDICYLNLAPALKDYSYCDKISSGPDNFKEYCYRDVAVALQDLNECKTLPSDSTIRDRCYGQIGIAQKNISICQLAVAEPEKDVCFDGVAGASNELAICDKYLSDDPQSSYLGSDRDQCYEEVAKQNSDLNICSKIVSPYYQDSCYQDVAISEGNASSCQNVKNLSKQSTCYERVAGKNQDDSICNLITEPNYPKNRCLQIVQTAKIQAAIKNASIQTSQITISTTTTNTNSPTSNAVNNSDVNKDNTVIPVTASVIKQNISSFQYLSSSYTTYNNAVILGKTESHKLLAPTEQVGYTLPGEKVLNYYASVSRFSSSADAQTLLDSYLSDIDSYYYHGNSLVHQIPSPYTLSTALYWRNGNNIVSVWANNNAPQLQNFLDQAFVAYSKLYPPTAN